MQCPSAAPQQCSTAVSRCSASMQCPISVPTAALDYSVTLQALKQCTTAMPRRSALLQCPTAVPLRNGTLSRKNGLVEKLHGSEASEASRVRSETCCPNTAKCCQDASNILRLRRLTEMPNLLPKPFVCTTSIHAFQNIPNEKSDHFCCDFVHLERPCGNT